IADANATTQVKVLQGNALVGQGFDQVDQFAQGVQVGADFGNLRADVAVDAYDVQARKLRGALVYRRRERNINTKLVFFQPGGNVGVRVGVHVRVHTQRDRRATSHFARDGRDTLQFAFGLYIEALDARFQRGADFPRLFAHTGKDDFGWITASGLHTRQLATRHNIEAGTQLVKLVQHGKVGVGFHAVANQDITPLRRHAVCFPRVAQGLA